MGSFSTVLCFRIWGHFPSLHVLGFGVIFCHSVLPLFQLLGSPIRETAVSVIMPPILGVLCPLLQTMTDCGGFYMWLQMSFAIRSVWKVAPSDLTLNSQVTVVTVSLNYYQCRNFMDFSITHSVKWYYSSQILF